MFTDKKVQDPKTENLMKRVKMLLHPDLAEITTPPPAIVTIKLRDGREFSKRVDNAKGSPEKPLSKEEMEAKYRGCTEPIIGRDRVDQSIDIIWNLDKSEDINQLMDIITVLKEL